MKMKTEIKNKKVYESSSKIGITVQIQTIINSLLTQKISPLLTLNLKNIQ